MSLILSMFTHFSIQVSTRTEDCRKHVHVSRGNVKDIRKIFRDFMAKSDIRILNLFCSKYCDMYVPFMNN